MESRTPPSDESPASNSWEDIWRLVIRVVVPMVHVVLPGYLADFLDEVISEVLLALLPIVRRDPSLQLSSLDDENAVARLRGLTRTIAKRRAIDALRKKPRLPRSLDESAWQAVPDAAFHSNDAVQRQVDRCRDAADRAADEDPKFRQLHAIWFRHGHGSDVPSITEIAQLLNLSRPAAHRLFQQFCARIKTLLEEEDGESDVAA